MAHILSFNSLACQESALHGLGQWQGTHDRQLPAIIDGFLAANPDIDPRLIRYAKAARIWLRALDASFRQLQLRAFLEQAPAIRRRCP